MLSLIKRYRELIIVSVLLLYPFAGFLVRGRRGRELHFLDRAVIGVTAPLQRGITALLDGLGGGVKGYVALRGVRLENEALRLENMQLKAVVQALGEARVENERLKKLLGYAEATPGPEIPARVLGVNPVAKLLSVRIDKGEEGGVFPGMSVVTPDGIVGQIIRATGGYADVALITDPQSRVGVRIQRSRARATAAGAGSKPLKLDNALRTEDIIDGDLVITSGTDGVYPPGLVVGRVSGLSKEDHGMFQRADIVPAVDTTKIEEVFVVPASVLTQVEHSSPEEGAR